MGGYNLVNDLMGFSIVGLSNKLLLYGGLYLEKQLGDQRNFNRNVIEVDVYNLTIKRKKFSFGPYRESS